MLGETNPSADISYISDFAPFSSIIDVTFSVTNVAATRVPSAKLTIYWPLNSPDPTQYFLYPIKTDNRVRYHICKLLCVYINIMCIVYYELLFFKN